jgi:hypothetical protein
VHEENQDASLCEIMDTDGTDSIKVVGSQEMTEIDGHNRASAQKIQARIIPKQAVTPLAIELEPKTKKSLRRYPGTFEDYVLMKRGKQRFTSGKERSGGSSTKPIPQLIFDFCLIHQQDWYVIAYRVNAAANRTLETFATFLRYQRFLADGTHEDVEKVLGNHGGILRQLDGRQVLRVHSFCFLQLSSRVHCIAVDREAGANPALPRNCKRGQSTGPLGSFGLREGFGRLRAAMAACCR